MDAKVASLKREIVIFYHSLTLLKTVLNKYISELPTLQGNVSVPSSSVSCHTSHHLSLDPLLCMLRLNGLHSVIHVISTGYAMFEPPLRQYFLQKGLVNVAKWCGL